jgi:hypothetical protein
MEPVIPLEAEIQPVYTGWILACAGVTDGLHPNDQDDPTILTLNLEPGTAVFR